MIRRSVLFVPLLLAGCGGPPALHPVAGKVTLGGKGYERLLVYFRPVSGDPDMYNLAVGETDAAGTMKAVKCSAGLGLRAGAYKVTFSCVRPKSGRAVAAGEKPDDNAAVVMQELVKPPHDDATSKDTAPVTFTVKSGDNTFVFDIPTP